MRRYVFVEKECKCVLNKHGLKGLGSVCKEIYLTFLMTCLLEEYTVHCRLCNFNREIGDRRR